jgi:hypothetical protein
MPSKILDIILVVFFLLCATVTFFLLAGFTTLSHSANILMAAGCRTLLLFAYRFYSPHVRGIPAWVVFEWAIPIVVLAELIIAACGLAPALGDGKFSNFGLFILILIYLILGVCIWSDTTNSYIKSTILFFFDMFTFLFLSSLYDASSGPYGSIHWGFVALITSIFSFPHSESSPSPPSPLPSPLLPSTRPLPSRTSFWSRFWTLSNSDPVIPLTTLDNVSPPPYTVSSNY